MEVIFEGKTYTGTRDELIREFRTALRLPYRWIGSLVGCSPTTVGTVLANTGDAGFRQYPELEQASTFEGTTDEELAKRFRLPKTRISAARYRAFGIEKSVGAVDLSTRRQFLSNTLFGLDPGPKFAEYFLELLDNGLLPDRQADLIKTFYLFGSGEDSAYIRSYRSYARDALREKVSEMDVAELIKKEVLSARP